MNYKSYEALLEERGTTTYRVCKDTGLDPSMFTNWKNGKYQPKFDKIQILAGYFGVPVSHFIE